MNRLKMCRPLKEDVVRYYFFTTIKWKNAANNVSDFLAVSDFQETWSFDGMIHASLNILN